MRDEGKRSRVPRAGDERGVVAMGDDYWLDNSLVTLSTVYRLSSTSRVWPIDGDWSAAA